MPSPFPGMNPYLEQEDVFHHFHEHFCSTCLEALVPLVRPHYFVKIDEHIYIHELPADERRLVGRGDLTVGRGSLPGPASGTATLAAPAYGRVPVAVDVERSSFVEIRDRRNRELVTIVELLSPSNKRFGPDREQYLAKRRQLLNSPVHLVEIDLLRGHPRMPVEALPDCDYCVVVSRAEDRPGVGIWPIRLREVLPPVPVPLGDGIAEVHLDLQALLHRMYDTGGYADYIYTGQPQPLLHPEDAAWAQQYVPPLC